jgi:regulator of protease activity HflC (stomatin/prohibitin superfamily)
MSKLQWGAVAVLMLWATPRFLTTYVAPDEVGVRRSLFGGVAHRDFAQGRVFDLPFVHTMYRLPKTLHYQDFGDTAALSLRTRENNVIEVDVTIIYEIVPGEGHLIVEQGFIDTYDDKVASICQGFLREHLAQLSSDDVQIPEKREAVAKSAVPLLGQALNQYHVRVVASGVVLRAIRFRDEYEQKLQDKQVFAVQARLDEAKGGEAEARTLTDTDEKAIDRDVKLETETWNAKIEEAKTSFEIRIAEITATALRYDREKRAVADATCASATADGQLAEAKAEAFGEKLKAEALSTPAGRTYSAIQAARAFKLGEVELNSSDPRFLQEFGSMDAWRRFFLAGAGR